MRVLTLCRELIANPDLFEQMQRSPPLAEEQVVQVANREEGVVGEHKH